MRISAIIPTYNRTQDLKECLDSISIQTVLPNEIIIIDNGDSDESANLIIGKRQEFEKINIAIRYIKNRRENSLTTAKNIGVKYATGDIVSFLDDDSVLDRSYYEGIIRAFIDKPSAFGITGLVRKEQKANFRSRFVELFNKLFFIYSKEKDTCKIFPSLGVSYALFASDVVCCEWLSGVATYRRSILKEFAFDENLKKYAWGEDQDISYRIFKKFPTSLFMTPFAKYSNKASGQGRMPSKDQFYMEEVYPLYLFYRIIDQKVKNKVIYVWSRIGRLIFNVLLAALRSEAKRKEITSRISAIIYCMKHRKEIKRGDLYFFNKVLERDNKVEA